MRERNATLLAGLSLPTFLWDGADVPGFLAFAVAKFGIRRLEVDFKDGTLWVTWPDDASPVGYAAGTWLVGMYEGSPHAFSPAEYGTLFAAEVRPGVAAPVEVFRKLAVEVEAVVWDGTPERARFLKEWTVQPNGTPGFLLTTDGLDKWEDARVWNNQESCWVACPEGHRVVKGRLGEFYPISPAAVAETYERVTP